MPNTKAVRHVGFIQEETSKVLSKYKYIKYVIPDVYLLPQGHNINKLDKVPLRDATYKLGRGPLADAIYQILPLWILRFQKKICVYVYPIQAYVEHVNPRLGRILSNIHKLNRHCRGTLGNARCPNIRAI